MTAGVGEGPTGPNFTFRALAAGNLPLLHRWLNLPHVLRWWREPLSEAETAAKYAPVLAGARPTRAFIILAEERPVGYIQTYRIADYPDYAAAVAVEPGAAGADLFLGEPDFVHRGHGAGVLREFARGHVFADPAVTCCIVGPEPANVAAIRCYEKAGFRHLKTVWVPGEPEPEYLMELRREALDQPWTTSTEQGA